MRDPFDFDLFIGYAVPDRPHAEALCAAARAAGLRVFIDLDLLAGDDVTIALPALRGQLDPDAEPRPVAFVDDPHQPRLVARLLAQLVQPAPTVADDAPGAIAAAFAAVPGGRPICVLDQFEEIFKSGDPLARARAGLRRRRIEGSRFPPLDET